DRVHCRHPHTPATTPHRGPRQRGPLRRLKEDRDMALTHGYVVGELIYSRADDYETPDGDRLPDMLPATEVVLTFTPAARQFISPDNQLVVADPIPAAVMDDGQITGDVNVTRNPNGTIATVTPK